MKPVIMDLSEMSDSTEIYNSRPSAVISYFIYSIIALFMVAIMWMCFSRIDVTVKGSGLFRNETASSDVSVLVAGVVNKCNIKEGDFVNKGDELLLIEGDDMEHSIKALEEQKADVDERISALESYASYLDGKSFNLSGSNKYFMEFNDKKKLFELSGVDNQNDLINDEIELNKSVILECNVKILELEKVENSIRNKANMVSESEGYYYTMAENFLSEYNLLNAKYAAQMEQAAGSPASVINAIEAERDASLLSLENSSLNNVKQNIESLLNQKKSAELEMATIEKKSRVQSNEKTNVAAKLQEKQSVVTELNSLRTRKDELDNSLSLYDEKTKKAKVVANKSGYIYLTQNVSEGSYVGVGTTICRIIPENTSNVYAEIYVENADIARLEVGQKVKFNVAAYPSSEYGDIEGKISYISNEIRGDESGKAYYLVKVECENSYVKNNKGGINQLVNGMVAEAKIVIGEKSIMQYVLERIRLWIE